MVLLLLIIFIFRLATKHGLSGQVENRNDGVVIEVNSTVEEVRRFRDAITREAPVASSIEHIEISEIAGRLFNSFVIDFIALAYVSSGKAMPS